MIFAMVAAVVFLSGCQQPSGPTDQGSGPDNQGMNCLEFCELQQHTQCVGEWSVSGTYPDCSCEFNCNEQPPEEPEEFVWEAGDVAVPGKYADAELVELENGSYRIYYSEEPEVQGFSGKIYSSVSSDGMSWTAEPGVRKEWATFPDIVQLDDGKYRMYYQNDNVIKSTTSSDGLSWTDESGTRISKTETGLVLENVAAPSVIKNGGLYIMVYRGTINERYSSEVPNSNTQLFLWATSSDGITFEKQGIALDSRNSVFNGLLDGPQLVLWEDGAIRLYFWSYEGVYHTTFENNAFSADAEFDYTTASDENVPFPSNPPCDPTLGKISGKWFLYYGQHTEGIFYATLEE
ncbi:MAG: hypothetical protein V1911_02750 [Candidatus Micrarchaeota archaeon]